MSMQYNTCSFIINQSHLNVLEKEERNQWFLKSCINYSSLRQGLLKIPWWPVCTETGLAGYLVIWPVEFLYVCHFGTRCIRCATATKCCCQISMSPNVSVNTQSPTTGATVNRGKGRLQEVSNGQIVECPVQGRVPKNKSELNLLSEHSLECNY